MTATAKSTTGKTVLVRVIVLSAEIGSATSERTLLRLLSKPSAVALASIATVVLAPTLKFPKLQVTTLPVTLQPLPGRVARNVTPPGNRLVSTTPVAVKGPLLLTVKV